MLNGFSAYGSRLTLMVNGKWGTGCHCEERSDVAISFKAATLWDCHSASRFAMTHEASCLPLIPFE